MQKGLSNCCKAEIKVENNGGTTNFWLCSKCDKPCDLFVENKNKNKE